ncbi:hypothetical protein AW736_10435 [Termitidicoccus mucosus]|uniref:Uncharacterized protein n=1 Tax=Termitidicoccus mucosus TaxID=1184151 RepID=A0A178IIK1_9BACT|nr:hypothetical protein AW736_10435 [Opitutaceae bacterium TSB47]
MVAARHLFMIMLSVPGNVGEPVGLVRIGPVITCITYIIMNISAGRGHGLVGDGRDRQLECLVNLPREEADFRLLEMISLLGDYAARACEQEDIEGKE